MPTNSFLSDRVPQHCANSLEWSPSEFNAMPIPLTLDLQAQCIKCFPWVDIQWHSIPTSGAHVSRNSSASFLSLTLTSDKWQASFPIPTALVQNNCYHYLLLTVIYCGVIREPSSFYYKMHVNPSFTLSVYLSICFYFHLEIRGIESDEYSKGCLQDNNLYTWDKEENAFMFLVQVF